MVFQAKGSDWTHLEGMDLRADVEDQLLSAGLKTDVLSFSISNTVGAMGYTHHRNGVLMEDLIYDGSPELNQFSAEEYIAKGYKFDDELRVKFLSQRRPELDPAVTNLKFLKLLEDLARHLELFIPFFTWYLDEESNAVRQVGGSEIVVEHAKTIVI